MDDQKISYEILEIIKLNIINIEKMSFETGPDYKQENEVVESKIVFEDLTIDSLPWRLYPSDIEVVLRFICNLIISQI